MNRCVRGLGTAGALLLAFASPMGPDRLAIAAPVEPFRLVRALEALQDRAAAGDQAAIAAQPSLVAEIATAFRAADPTVWRERRNADAAMVFLFSGGSAAAVRSALAGEAFDARDRPRVRAALAYAEGRSEEARRQLATVDPRSLGPSIAGPLALVAATLVMHEDPARAMRLLDLARLLSPGSLIEEAALRRQVFISDERGDAKAFARAAATYRRRFPRSVYGQSVERRLKPAIERFAGQDVEAASQIIDLLPAEVALQTRLDLARAALIEGRLDRAGALALAAGALAEPGSGPALRARLYGLAAALPAPDAAAALSTLAASELPEPDRTLLEAARAAAGAITSPAPLSHEAEPAGSSEPDAVRAALEALAGSSALLEETP